MGRQLAEKHIWYACTLRASGNERKIRFQCAAIIEGLCKTGAEVGIVHELVEVIAIRAVQGHAIDFVQPNRAGAVLEAEDAFKVSPVLRPWHVRGQSCVNPGVRVGSWWPQRGHRNKSQQRPPRHVPDE